MCFFLITNAPLGQCQVEEAATQPRSQGGVRQDRQDLVVQRRELLPHLPGYLLVTSSTLTLRSSFCTSSLCTLDRNWCAEEVGCMENSRWLSLQAGSDHHVVKSFRESPNPEGSLPSQKQPVKEKPNKSFTQLSSLG